MAPKLPADDSEDNVGISSYVRWVAWLTLCLWLLVVPAANAYLDPGSGSLVFQVVAGAAMALSLGVKVFWRRIRMFFARRSDE